jgi:hypothetical protein
MHPGQRVGVQPHLEAGTVRHRYRTVHKGQWSVTTRDDAVRIEGLSSGSAPGCAAHS